MATEHSIIVDPLRHEPKGIITAAVNEVYNATGGGTDGGSWGPPILPGQLTATLGQRFVSDGAGSGSWKDSTNIHGEMIISGYTTPLVVAAATDATLATDTDYQKITAASMWSAGHLTGITFNVDELVLTVAGDYEINFWASVESSATNSLIGVKYSINDTTPYSLRKILHKSKTTSDINSISGIGYAAGLSVGDTISLYIAADIATNIIGREAGLSLKLLDEI